MSNEPIPPRLRRFDPLVSHLESLVKRDDRATLAALRGSLREGRELDALRVVLPFLGSEAKPWAEDDASLIAGLFALHPHKQTAWSRSLAAAMGLIQQRNKESDSVERRFRALLGASRADLPHHLRHAVSLIKSNEILINWRDLYRAVSNWNHPDDFIRPEWARDFWVGPGSAASTDELNG